MSSVSVCRWSILLGLLLSSCRRDEGAEPPPPAFTLKLAATTVTAPRDSTGRVRVLIERRPDFTEPIELNAINLPPGVLAEPVVAEEDEAELPLRLSADLAPGPLQLDLEGRAGELASTVRLQVEVLPEAPRAQELIAAALATGELDRGTSLLYRAYAVFGDSRLPPAFVGSGPEEEDLSFIEDLETARPTLPAHLLEQLEPFLVRPDDPKSVFNAGAPSGSQKRQALLDAAHCTGDTREWITLRSATHPVRAWALCPGTGGGDANAERQLNKIISVVDAAWGPMVSRMGMGPAKDDQTGDEAIDVYVVPPGANAPRARGDYAIEGVRGAAFPQPPYAGGTCSGYVMLPTWRLALRDYQLTVIHELFHVLQFAHMYQLTTWWFTEASATWASMHVNRTAPIRPAANQGLHLERFGGFQGSRRGLLSTAGDHEYFAYIWPFFMEHEGDEALIAALWSRAGGLSGIPAANTALNGVFSFKDHFRDFAIRNLNESLLPGDPVSPRHHARDPAHPENALFPSEEAIPLTGNQEQTRQLQLEPLAARYYRLRVELDSQVQRVELDLSALSGREHLDVDALINNPDAWLSSPVKLTETRPRFCFDLGPSNLERKGSFAELLLVLSNHSHTGGEQVTGTLKVKPSKAGCAGWMGNTWWSQVNDTAQVRSNVSSMASVTFEVDEDPPGGSTPGVVHYKVVSGAASYHAELTFPTCRQVSTANVEMSPDATTGEGATFASLSTFSLGEVLKYGGISGSTIGTITTTGNCTGDGSEQTFVTPDSLIPWWVAGEPYFDLKEDGTLMEEDLTSLGGTRNRWSLRRVER
ncbi:MAG: hypothetical protein Q8L48_31135 [Archangium sp.]|nr:hypothetical protein [Archangium sp.]